MPFCVYFLNSYLSHYLMNKLCLLLQGLVCFVSVVLVKCLDQFHCCFATSGKQRKLMQFTEYRLEEVLLGEALDL